MHRKAGKSGYAVSIDSTIDVNTDVTFFDKLEGHPPDKYSLKATVCPTFRYPWGQLLQTQLPPRGKLKLASSAVEVPSESHVNGL